MSPAPRATYRLQLQLHGEFGFDAAAGILDYLKALGVSHVYVSPYLQAARGSRHGYDVVDHSRVNEELGGEDAHGREGRWCQTFTNEGVTGAVTLDALLAGFPVARLVRDA